MDSVRLLWRVTELSETGLNIRRVVYQTPFVIVLSQKVTTIIG
jgi:hypothetical protein